MGAEWPKVVGGLPCPSINSLVLSRLNSRPAQTRRPGGASHLERALAQGAGGHGVLVRLGLSVSKGIGAAPGVRRPGRRRPEGQRYVRRRRRAELTAEIGAQPTQGEREAKPGRRAQHVRQHAQVESESCLAAQARGHVRQAAGGSRVLPGPLELRAGVRASGPRGEGGHPGSAPSPSPSSRRPVSFLTRRAATAEGKPCTISTISLEKRTPAWPVTSHPVSTRIPSSRFASSPAQAWSAPSRPQTSPTRPCPLRGGPSPRTCQPRAPPQVTGT